MSSALHGFVIACLLTGVPVFAHAAQDPSVCVPGRNDYLDSEITEHDGQVAVLPACHPGGNETDLNLANLDDSIHRICSPQPADDGSIVPAECIRFALARCALPTSKVKYGVCDPQSDEVRSKLEGCVGRHCELPPPCASDKYVGVIRRSVIGALGCVGVDPKEMFGLFTNESHFQVNVYNSAGAWGIGQVLGSTGRSILELHWFRKYRDKPECAPYRDLIDDSGAPHATRGCEMIGFPANPLRNLLYSAMLYRYYRDEAERLVRDVHGLSGADRKKVIHDLALYEYNGGNGAIKQAYLAFRQEQEISSYGQFKTDFKNYLRESYGDGLGLFGSDPDRLERKRREVAAYASVVDSAGEAANSGTGKECSL